MEKTIENIWKQKKSISHRNIQLIFVFCNPSRDTTVQALVGDIPRQRCPLCDHFPSLSRFAMDDRTIKVEAKGLLWKSSGFDVRYKRHQRISFGTCKGGAPHSYKLVSNLIN